MRESEQPSRQRGHRDPRDIQIRELEAKIARLQRERSVYAAKTRLLAQELEYYRQREGRQGDTVEQLLERQHELNVMLNRSNIMLARAQDAAAMLSLEFNDLARALPAPASADGASAEVVEIPAEEISERISRINDLFRRTGSLAEEIASTLQESQSVQREAVRNATASTGPPTDWQPPSAGDAAYIETGTPGDDTPPARNADAAGQPDAWQPAGNQETTAAAQVPGPDAAVTPDPRQDTLPPQEPPAQAASQPESGPDAQTTRSILWARSSDAPAAARSQEEESALDAAVAGYAVEDNGRSRSIWRRVKDSLFS